jgi:hypothetical protein
MLEASQMDDIIKDIFSDEEQRDAEYQGKKVTLNKPFRTPNESKKFGVYVENENGNVVIVRFGDPNMEIKRDDPDRKKAFRERHNCENKNDKTKAGYWSCKFWSSKSVNELLSDGYTIDSSSPLSIKSNIDKDTGFLKINGVLARTGVQDYMGFELPFIDGLDPMKTYGVYRSKDEVLRKESLKSYINAPITDDHPKEFVTIDNISDLGKGSVSDVSTHEKEGVDYVSSDIIITDKKTIDKILNGKIELSAGYSATYDNEKGEFQGKPYDFVQKDIKINHVALVERGRCGKTCKVGDSYYDIIENVNLNEREKMHKLKIGNVEVEVCDTVAGAYNSLENQVSSLTKEKKTLDEEMKQKEKDTEKEMGSKDTEIEMLKKEIEDLKEKAKKTDDSSIMNIVNDRVKLLTSVSSLVGDEDLSSLSNAEIKKKVISKVQPSVSLEGRSEDYIGGKFDTLMEKMNQKTNDNKTFGDGFKPKDTMSAREKYMKDTLGVL